MPTIESIGSSASEVKEFWRRLEAQAFAPIRGVLTNTLIGEACQAAQWNYRQRKLTPILMILHMTLAALWPEHSFAASWQVLWSGTCALDPAAAKLLGVGSGVLAKARLRIPREVWHFLSAAVAKRAAETSAALDTWRGLRPVLLDGTCVSMPAEKALFQAFGTNNKGKSRIPVARLVVLGLARSRTILAYALGGYRTSETTLARGLRSHLQPKDLVIADRLFAAAHAYALYVRQQVDFITRVHAHLKIAKLRKLRIYSPSDFVVQMPLNRVYRRRFPELALPEYVTVRLICAEIRDRNGTHTIWLATSLLSANDFPAEEIVARYGERWGVETLIRELKCDAGATVLRSKTPQGIANEMAARITGLNAIRILMLEAALPRRMDPLRLSLVQALRTVLAYAPAFAAQPVNLLPALYRRMLAELARQTIATRPGRQEPRKIRRDPKNYSLLHTTRQQWRASIPA